jgi:hypothetical protein
LNPSSSQRSNYIILYIYIYNHFAEIYDGLKNFTLLTTIRRGPRRFQDVPPWATTVRKSPVGPHERGGQLSWPTTVSDKSSCATATSQTAVAHGGMTRPAAVAYGGKFPTLCISRVLARKCHKNSENNKERVGKERGGE